VKYNRIVARLTLADITSLANPLLSLENRVLGIILLIFINYINEDLELSTLLVEV